MDRKPRYAAQAALHGAQDLPALREAGYQGSEITISRYVAEKRRESLVKEVYLPLEFDPGQDAQVDWGAAVVELNGERRVQAIVPSWRASGAFARLPALADIPDDIWDTAYCPTDNPATQRRTRSMNNSSLLTPYPVFFHL